MENSLAFGGAIAWKEQEVVWQLELEMGLINSINLMPFTNDLLH